MIEASIGDGLNRLLDHDYRLRIDHLDALAEDVHQARVATRRLRSDLKLFGPVLDPVWLRHTRAELKWIGEVLGEVRDLDVLAASIFDRSGEQVMAGGTTHLRSQLDDRRKIASGKLSDAIASDRFLKLLDRLHAAAQGPPIYEGASAPAKRTLPRLVRRRMRALRRKVRKVGSHRGAKDLHRIRMKAKQLRYAAETAAPVLGKHAVRTAKAAEHLQNILGDHHDAIGAQQWLIRQGLCGPAESRFVAGWMAAEQKQRQRELCLEWPPAWKQLREEGSRWRSADSKI